MIFMSAQERTYNYYYNVTDCASEENDNLFQFCGCDPSLSLSSSATTCLNYHYCT